MEKVDKQFPEAVLIRNDKKASRLIWVVSLVVFSAVAFLANIKFKINPGFDPHIFALVNAIINSIVAVLLIAAFIAVRNNYFYVHKKLMITAIILSVLFLISYICHHLLAGETMYGDLNHDHVLSGSEKLRVGAGRYVYYFILATHIPLAAIILPFILFTAYRALTGNYGKHKKLARITWPIWLYVAITGVIVYIMISPYYSQ